MHKLDLNIITPPNLEISKPPPNNYTFPYLPLIPLPSSKYARSGIKIPLDRGMTFATSNLSPIMINPPLLSLYQKHPLHLYLSLWTSLQWFIVANPTWNSHWVGWRRAGPWEWGGGEQVLGRVANLTVYTLSLHSSPILFKLILLTSHSLPP